MLALTPTIPAQDHRKDAKAEVMAILAVSDTRPLTADEHARLRAAERRHNGEAG